MCDLFVCQSSVRGTDASGWHSDGDSFSFYKDKHGNPIAIDISKGETTLDITLDEK